MVNINLIPEKQKRYLEREEQAEKELNDRAEGKHIKPEKADMTFDEYGQMYNSGYADKGIKMISMSCRKCGSVKEVASSSQSAYDKICNSCKRKIQKVRTVIEI